MNCVSSLICNISFNCFFRNRADRDYNAALNIKAFGIKILEANTAGIAEIYARGDTSIGDQVANWSRFVSLKQEAACSLEPR